MVDHDRDEDVRQEKDDAYHEGDEPDDGRDRSDLTHGRKVSFIIITTIFTITTIIIVIINIADYSFTNTVWGAFAE